MTFLTIDFEAYYDPQFSLSKMTTEEYIRDPRFEVIGVGVKQDAGQTEWFSGTKAETKRFLNRYDWANAIALAHNAPFDMAILGWVFGIHPKKIADTLSMGRATDGPDAGNSLKAMGERYGVGVKGDEVIHALGKRRLDFTTEELNRYGSYCCNDVDMTYDLFNELMRRGFPASELAVIDATVKMFSRPLLWLDRDLLETHLTEVKAKKESLINKALVDKDDLMSNAKFAKLLEDLGVEPPMKVSPTTGKDTYAFAKSDEALKALLNHENPLVQAIVAARLGVKSTLEETRTERFIDISKRGSLPVPLRYYAAHTGRWGGDDKVNLQNLPRKSMLKKAIQAPEGYVVIDCDSSQIEARVLAWMSGQDDLVDAFAKGEDVYKIMASAIYGVPVEEVDDAQRFVGKTTILGAGYGMGAKKFQAQLKTFNVTLPLEECERIISVYRETYPMIPRLWRSVGDALEAMANRQYTDVGYGVSLRFDGIDGVLLPNGLRLRYPGLRFKLNEDKKMEMVYDTKKGKAVIPTRIYGGKAVENVCQALARIVVSDQLVQISRRLPVVMTVHDAVGSLAPKEKADEARAYVEACMRKAPAWADGLPLNCESKMGETYGG